MILKEYFLYIKWVFNGFNPLCDIACNFGELTQFYTDPVVPPIFQGQYDMI